MDDFTLAVARILKDAQTREGQPTYDEIAERTKLGRATVARTLNGQRDITMRYLRELCSVLGLDPAKVLDEANRSL